MIARPYTAFVAFLAIASNVARAQDELIWVDVAHNNQSNLINQDILEGDEIEKRYTPELVEELLSAKADALLLYTEYSAKAGSDLKDFLKNISGYAADAIRSLDSGVEDPRCRAVFDASLHKIENDAQRAASFSAENHHKFLLGHMVVFRMHLNKSDDYIKKCDKAIKNCGVSCETIPRVKRWRRLALEEIHRVRDDLQHSRRSYRDLVAHARRKLNHLRKQVTTRARDAVNEYHECIQRG